MSIYACLIIKFLKIWSGKVMEIARHVFLNPASQNITLMIEWYFSITWVLVLHTHTYLYICICVYKYIYTVLSHWYSHLWKTRIITSHNADSWEMCKEESQLGSWSCLLGCCVMLAPLLWPVRLGDKFNDQWQKQPDWSCPTYSC